MISTSNDLPTSSVSTLSLHDALPIFATDGPDARGGLLGEGRAGRGDPPPEERGHVDGDRRGVLDIDDAAREVDRKSTRLNSSHVETSYAVFCLKKKMKYNRTTSIHSS